MQRYPDPADTKAASLLALRADFLGNDTATQRALLLAALQSHGVVSTLEARAFLDILHPAGRIKELRGLGHNIVTLWADKPTEAGKLHRVGVYLLARVPAEAEVAP
jgi:Helix-turn-helix domain